MQQPFKETLRSSTASIVAVAASLPWGGILAGATALLGSAGGAAASFVTQWLVVPLLCASLLLLGWSFYNQYVRGLGSRTTAIITWISFIFIVCFWTVQLVWGIWG